MLSNAEAPTAAIRTRVWISQARDGRAVTVGPAVIDTPRFARSSERNVRTATGGVNVSPTTRYSGSDFGWDATGRRAARRARTAADPGAVETGELSGDLVHSHGERSGDFTPTALFTKTR